MENQKYEAYETQNYGLCRKTKSKTLNAFLQDTATPSNTAIKEITRLFKLI